MSCMNCIDVGQCDGSCNFGGSLYDREDDWCIGCSNFADACRCDEEDDDECFLTWSRMFGSGNQYGPANVSGQRRLRRKGGYSASPSRRFKRRRLAGMFEKNAAFSATFDPEDLIQAKGDELFPEDLRESDEIPF